MTSHIVTVTAVCCVWSLTNAAEAKKLTGGRTKVEGESLVLAETSSINLCFSHVVKGSLVLRSTFITGEPETLVYDEGQDYVVDHDLGTVRRTPKSRIPDYSAHCLYGLEDFDHAKFPDYSNHKWFVWADYETTNGRAWAKPNNQGAQLAGVRKKLDGGGPFKIASYGDSITAGGEASEPRFRFQQRYAEFLRSRFPKAVIDLQDVSISGYASRQGIDWFDKYMGTVDHPDLALVGFGINDHNIGNTEPEAFKSNLVTLVTMIRERKGAEVILFSAFPPNENWHYGTHRMERYAAATKQAASDAGCAYVDVYSTWKMVLSRKDQSSLLGNNINHPNNFGHWLYEQAFEAMGF